MYDNRYIFVYEEKIYIINEDDSFFESRGAIWRKINSLRNEDTANEYFEKIKKDYEDKKFVLINFNSKNDLYSEEIEEKFKEYITYNRPVDFMEIKKLLKNLKNNGIINNLGNVCFSNGSKSIIVNNSTNQEVESNYIENEFRISVNDENIFWENIRSDNYEKNIQEKKVNEVKNTENELLKMRDFIKEVMNKEGLL